MFDELKDYFKPVVQSREKRTPAVEGLLTKQGSELCEEPCTPKDQPAQPKPPTPKYGAVEVPLISGNVDRKALIREIPRDGGLMDYEVYIMRAINASDMFDEVVNILKYASAQTKVTFYICSPGGTLSVATRLVAAMDATLAHTITVAAGGVASAAALIWTHGKEKIVLEGSPVMFHMSSHWDYGNSTAVRTKADFFVRYAKEIAIDPAVAQGILTAEEAEAVVDRRQDVYIDSYEMTKRLESNNG